jgi:hypothetical protein
MYSLPDTIVSSKWALAVKRNPVEPFTASGPSLFLRSLSARDTTGVFRALYVSTPLDTSIPLQYSEEMGPIVIDSRSSLTDYTSLPSNIDNLWGDMPPFTFTYKAPSQGVIVVSVTATAHADSGVLTKWWLSLKINGSRPPNGFIGGGSITSGQTSGSSSVDLQFSNMSFVYPIPVQANASINTVLQGSQTNQSGDEGIAGVSWTVIFYPS